MRRTPDKRHEGRETRPQRRVLGWPCVPALASAAVAWAAVYSSAVAVVVGALVACLVRHDGASTACGEQAGPLPGSGDVRTYPLPPG